MLPHFNDFVSTVSNALPYVCGLVENSHANNCTSILVFADVFALRDNVIEFKADSTSMILAALQFVVSIGDQMEQEMFQNPSTEFLL